MVNRDFDSDPQRAGSGGAGQESEPQAGRAPSRLGRGLAALIGDVDGEVQAVERARNQRRLPVEFLRANPRNPRRDFDETALADLASSIRERGIVQPILARPAGDNPDRFEIIAGERRWRAAQIAGLHEVPVIIHRIGDREALELAIIENVQRSDLNPLEEAEGYQRLAEEFGRSQADIAASAGKSRSHIANTMRLLKLPDTVQSHLREGRLTAGHARAIITHDDPEALADAIIQRELNVRDTEALAKEPRARKAPEEKDADTRALERQLSDALGLDVEIRHKPGGSGEVRVKYRTLEQLDGVVGRLGRAT